MQRLFSMFPTAGPGVALMLLRVAVAISLALPAPDAQPVTPVWLAAPVAVLLSFGVLTPILASFAAVAFGATVFVDATLEPARVSLVLCTVALALLGPGAYSFDAWRFGRRIVVASEAGDPVE